MRKYVVALAIVAALVVLVLPSGVFAESARDSTTIIPINGEISL